MKDKDSQNSSAPNTSKREQVSRKITKLVDNLPLFPTDIDQLLTAAVKPTEDGTEILRLIESDPKLCKRLLILARSYFGRTENFKSIEGVVQHMGMDHCEVGARICRRWNFSPVVQEAVLRHHSPILDGDFCFAGALIFLSHFVSASDPSGDILATLLASKVLNKLDLTPVDFERARDLYESRTKNGGR